MCGLFVLGNRDVCKGAPGCVLGCFFSSAKTYGIGGCKG